MKIALLSYEFPPDTAFGGIATYVQQASKMLQGRGHSIEVFAGSPYRSESVVEEGFQVHRVRVGNQETFAPAIGRLFAERHAVVGFDVLEGPEFSADAREAVRLVPEVPLVVKLHTPSLVLWKLNFPKPSFRRLIRLFLGRVRRRERVSWGYDPQFEAARRRILAIDRVERAHALRADEVAAPSRAIATVMAAEWGLSLDRVSHVPYAFTPTAELLAIPVRRDPGIVTFIGRLETRKGVLDLARAIPLVLQRDPGVRFRFVGSAEPSPRSGMDMRKFLELELQDCAPAVEFTGPVPYAELPRILAEAGICIFPSLWENFPCVCLEAMAAGCAVIGSSAGGMEEMLDSGKVGIVLPPRNPSRLARAILRLLRSSELRSSLGEKARARLLSEYNEQRVGALQEASYAKAIDQRKRLGERHSLQCTA